MREKGGSMLIAVYASGGHVELHEAPMPQIKPGEVLVRVRASAVCGSELHDYRRGSGGRAGHEAVGEVVQVQEVPGLAVGQHVAIQVLSGCGHCVYCLAGDPKHCAQTRFHGGLHAEYVAVPAQCCLVLPDDIAWDTGVLLGGDTIGTPYHALQRLGVSAADTAAVFGCGPIGLGTTALLHHYGVRTLAVESVTYRRELAVRLGAEMALDPAAGDPVARLRELTGGKGADVAVDCAGVPATTGMALDAAAIYGRVAFLGEKPEAPIRPSPQFIRKELTVIGSWYFTLPDYARILALYRQGLDVAGLITHRFPLAEIDQAFATFASGQTGKVVLLQTP
jgi:threonine dehydrogenase-like Zn-dependent dehydrogenase